MSEGTHYTGDMPNNPSKPEEVVEEQKDTKSEVIETGSESIVVDSRAEALGILAPKPLFEKTEPIVDDSAASAKGEQSEQAAENSKAVAASSEQTAASTEHAQSPDHTDAPVNMPEATSVPQPEVTQELPQKIDKQSTKADTEPEDPTVVKKDKETPKVEDVIVEAIHDEPKNKNEDAEPKVEVETVETEAPKEAKVVVETPKTEKVVELNATEPNVTPEKQPEPEKIETVEPESKDTQEATAKSATEQIAEPAENTVEKDTSSEAPEAKTENTEKQQPTSPETITNDPVEAFMQKRAELLAAEAEKNKREQLLDLSDQVSEALGANEDVDLVVPDSAYLKYLKTLTPQQLKHFESLDRTLQDKRVANFMLEEEAKSEEIDHTPTAKEPEVKKVDAIEDNAEQKKPATEAIITTFDAATVTEFIEKMSLSAHEKSEFMKLSQTERDRQIKNWVESGRPDWVEVVDEFFKQNGLNNGHFNSVQDRDIEINSWLRNGKQEIDTFDVYGDSEGVGVPSYRIYDIDPVTGERHTIANIKRGLTKEYTHEEKEHLEKMRKSQLDWKYKTKSKLVGWAYILIHTIFDVERVLAEENKKQQEMIRAIVDTGPDVNERAVFAQKMADGTWKTYKGEIVHEDVVKHQRKLALENPSRFQALCHYELSKREESDQIEVWEEIFNMMAHENYNMYHMYGVIVGLQFMNKPMYLAFKQAKLEYAPVYEEHHGKPVVDPETGEPVAKVYTADDIYENGLFGRRIKRHPDGKKVQIGDIIRNPTKVRFETETVRLDPSDQEYSEINPSTRELRYGKTVYVKNERVLENGEKVIEYEERKVREKRILKIKPVDFAHEIAGKFASYQYGFRSADVSIMLDVTRKALRESLDRARNGDTTSVEFQQYQYVLSRINFCISATRLGGSTPGEDGKAPIADARLLEDANRNAMQRPGNMAPKISGPAEAQRLWEVLAEVSDLATRHFPNTAKIRQSDFEAIQDQFKTRNEHFALAA